MRARRWILTALTFLLLAGMLSGCTTAGDAEDAISDQSHGRLTDPDCEKFDDDMGETTFVCSADDGKGRIKLMVSFAREGDLPPLVTEWPCVPDAILWKQIRHDPALQCGRNLPAS